MIHYLCIHMYEKCVMSYLYSIYFMRWLDANLCSPINSRRLCDRLWHCIAIYKFCSTVCVGTRFPVLNKILLFHGSGPIGMNFLHVFSIELQFHLVCLASFFSLSLFLRMYTYNSVWITESYSPITHATPPHTMAQGTCSHFYRE